ncbi:hypothetical protein [Bacteroides finegoldii]
MIDKGHLSAPYIEIYESFSNDSICRFNLLFFEYKWKTDRI